MSFLGSLFGSPDMPAPPQFIQAPAPPSPADYSRSSDDTQKKQDAARAEERKKARGRAANILTGPEGLLEGEKTSSKKTLMGGG